MLKDDPKAAAISSRMCADIYDTSVIAENIQDTNGMSVKRMIPNVDR